MALIAACATITGLVILIKDRRVKKQAAADHAIAVRYLRIIVSGEIRTEADTGFVYGKVCERNLRELVQTNLGRPDPRTGAFVPHQITTDQIMLPECQRTIKGVIEAVGRFILKNPEAAAQLKLGAKGSTTCENQ